MLRAGGADAFHRRCRGAVGAGPARVARAHQVVEPSSDRRLDRLHQQLVAASVFQVNSPGVSCVTARTSPGTANAVASAGAQSRSLRVPSPSDSVKFAPFGYQLIDPVMLQAARMSMSASGSSRRISSPCCSSRPRRWPPSSCSARAQDRPRGLSLSSRSSHPTSGRGCGAGRPRWPGTPCSATARRAGRPLRSPRRRSSSSPGGPGCGCLRRRSL